MASSGFEVPTSELSPTEVELVNRVHSHFPNNEPDRFHFFYETACPFSNFHRCAFAENGIQFDTSERYMMYHKAKLFGDDETAQAILEAAAPADCKALGRMVRNFDGAVWTNNRTRIMTNGLQLKFTQDARMKAALLQQRGNLLVEAAGNDRIWGVGMKKDNPAIKKRANWKGLNLLGYVLTDVLQKMQS